MACSFKRVYRLAETLVFHFGRTRRAVHEHARFSFSRVAAVFFYAEYAVPFLAFFFIK
jgi:hypothetical protein